MNADVKWTLEMHRQLAKEERVKAAAEQAADPKAFFERMLRDGLKNGVFDEPYSRHSE